MIMRYRITKWHEYQHYKDRCPPWIKLHHAMLTSEAWVMNNDETRVLIIACMLLASRTSGNDGTFNADPEYVKRFAYLSKTPNFKPLIDCGFIECLQDASNEIAPCNTEERRGEIEERKVDKKRAHTLPEDFNPLDAHFELADKEGINLHIELEKFVDYHKAKGSVMKDWNAALRTWIRNAAGFAKKNTPTQTRQDRLQHTGDLLTGRKPLDAAFKLD